MYANKIILGSCFLFLLGCSSAIESELVGTWCTTTGLRECLEFKSDGNVVAYDSDGKQLNLFDSDTNFDIRSDTNPKELHLEFTKDGKMYSVPYGIYKIENDVLFIADAIPDTTAKGASLPRDFSGTVTSLDKIQDK